MPQQVRLRGVLAFLDQTSPKKAVHRDTMPSKKTPVSTDIVRRIALAFPEAVESSHFDSADFRVRNKIFATLPRTPGVACMKTTSGNLSALMAADPLTYSDAWSGRWLRVQLDRITLPDLTDLIAEAWCLVAPKALSKAYLAAQSHANHDANDGSSPSAQVSAEPPSTRRSRRKS